MDEWKMENGKSKEAIDNNKQALLVLVLQPSLSVQRRRGMLP